MSVSKVFSLVCVLSFTQGLLLQNDAFPLTQPEWLKLYSDIQLGFSLKCDNTPNCWLEWEASIRWWMYFDNRFCKHILPRCYLNLVSLPTLRLQTDNKLWRCRYIKVSPYPSTENTIVAKRYKFFPGLRPVNIFQTYPCSQPTSGLKSNLNPSFFPVHYKPQNVCQRYAHVGQRLPNRALTHKKERPLWPLQASVVLHVQIIFLSRGSFRDRHPLVGDVRCNWLSNNRFTSSIRIKIRCTGYSDTFYNVQMLLWSSG